VKRLAATLAAVALGLAIPPLATAQLGPTNVPAPLTQTQPSDDTVAPEKALGMTTLQLVLIFGAAIGVIGLIGYMIMRDANRAAPAAQRASAKAAAAAGGSTSGSGKSARERERERARKRSKAKAARNQRKRNRPR
jgi:hypothetical protein